MQHGDPSDSGDGSGDGSGASDSSSGKKAGAARCRGWGKLICCLSIAGALVVVAGGVLIVLGAEGVFSGGGVGGGPCTHLCKVCASGAVVTQERAVDAFRDLEVTSGFRVEVQTGEGVSLSITDQKNVIDSDVAEVQSTTLNLYRKPRFCGGTPRASVGAAAPLESIKAHGGSQVSVDSAVGTLTMDGGSRITVGDLTASNTVTVKASGGSHVDVSGGTVQALTFDGGGGSHADLGHLKVATTLVLSLSGGSSFTGGRAKTVTIDSMGGSRATVYATDSAEVQCSGGGTIKISGGATVTKHTSGGCTVVEERRRLRGA